MPSSRIFLAATLLVAVLAGALSGAAAFVFAPAWMPYLAARVPSSRGWVSRAQSLYVPQSASSSLISPLVVPASGEEAIVHMVERVSPAVVSIVVTKKLTNERRQITNPFNDFFGDPFSPFFEVPRTERGPLESEPREVGGGSGFFVSADGMIVTNKHVVNDPRAEYTVVTQDQKKYPAKVLALDPVLDLAILKVEGEGFAFLPLGDSEKIRIGQTVIAIGNALAEFQNTVTRGVISGLNRRVIAGGATIGSEVIESAIQTDAAINPGNSGGPLVDLQGNVIGINTAVSERAQSLGFALPSNVVGRAITSVQKQGRIVRAWLGVRFMPVSEALAKKNQLPYSYGVLILRGETPEELAIVPGSPADRAGLSENDIILEIDGVKLGEATSLSAQIERHTPGDKVKLKVFQKGSEKDIEVILQERPANQ